MIGHARPVSLLLAAARRVGRALVPRGWFVEWSAVAWVLVFAALAAAQHDLFDQPVRMRIAWGGKAPARWSGRIALSNGSLADVQLLGMEADAAAAVWLDGSVIHVRSLSPRLFDGVDVTLTAAKDARLSVSMSSEASAAPVEAEVRLADAVRSPFYLPLDQRGNELLVQRAPGDTLRIVTNRDQLIFAPGEQFSFDVKPVVDEIEPSTTIDIDTTLGRARGSNTLWHHSQRLPVPVEGPAIATLHVPLPREEGVYQIRVAVMRPAGFHNRFLPGARNKPLAERSFQVVVLNPAPPAPPATGTWQPVLEIDPTNPRWWERLPDWTQIRRIPGVPRRPLGSLRAVAVSHSLGNFIELPATVGGNEPHWQAYPLPLESTGVPHLLEVEYPADLEQHLGISIVEPNAAGRVVPIGRDSGLYVEGVGHSARAEKHKHRLVFWPRTNTPLLLVTNQHPTAAGRFGSIRVLKRTTGSIATEAWPAAPPTDRLIAAYLSRPLLPETFGASEGLDVLSGYSIDDWQTFFEGATRLAEYLNYAGYNAAAVSVLADGSCVFPSQHVLSTPLYNTGRMVAGASDLPSTDALELLLRVFDRCGMALVPTLQLAAPLPELEARRRDGDPREIGIELVGPKGQTWLEANGSERGLAPYYNLLDERVQQAVLGVAREIIDRYGHHPSLGGLAVQLSGQGYAMLPGIEWGLDDTTIGRFEEETGILLPKRVSDRFAVRQALLTGEHVDAWRTWRTARVSGFYRELAELLRSSDSERKLVLTTEDMFSNPAIAARFRPSVPQKVRLDRVMSELGIDRGELEKTPGLVLCSTRYVESMVPLVDRAVDIEINRAFAATQKLPASTGLAASMFYHRPQRRSLASFDAVSPFESHTRLVNQPLPDAVEGRRRFVAALRDHDPRIILDGGELLPMGQEDATRNLLRLLQQLPSEPASNLLREQSVTVRSYDSQRGTTCVVVNECPWPAEVDLDIQVPVTTVAKPLLSETAAIRPDAAQTFAAGQQRWALSLGPYDAHAVRFAARGVRVEKIGATVGEAARSELAARVSDFRDRDLNTSRPYAGLENPSFEPLSGGSLTGWRLAGGSQATVELDATMPQDGKTCLYLRNRGQDVATLESNDFATPTTGQMAMTVFVRGENLQPSTELRLVFETERPGTSYRRLATLGGDRPGAQPLGDQWGYGFAFRREDLPLDSRSRMRIKFELTGPGEVWIDNVKLYDLLFPLPFYEHASQEKYDFVKLQWAADKALADGNLSDCIELLEGYWPRFLNAHTPIVRPEVAEQPSSPEPAAPSAAKKTDDPPSVSDRWWLPSLPSIWKR